jgi:hypothetical protein
MLYPDDSSLIKWRRRESNPQTECHFTLENKEFCASQKGLAADWQRSDCQCSDEADSDLQIIRELHLLHDAWPQLDSALRRAILQVIRSLRKWPE